MTTKRNAFSRKLMHKGFTETIIPGDPEEIKNIRFVDKLRTGASRGDASSIKRLANKEWYEKHKAWKKAYNAKYYRDNKDYWQNYYNFTYRTMKSRQKMADDATKKADQTRLKYGENSKEYENARRVADTNAKWVRERRGDFEAAKLNLERSQKDYQWYMDNHKKMKATEAWSDGAKMIRDAGKNFLSKFGLKL